MHVQEEEAGGAGALRDLRQVRIDRTKPTAERIRSYTEQIGNPYRFRVGDTVVSVTYAAVGKNGRVLSLNESFLAVLAAGKR